MNKTSTIENRKLLEWTLEPSAERGIRFLSRTFLNKTDEWQYWSYESLAMLAWRAQDNLVQSGVRVGDVVGLALRTGPEFIGCFFGALLAGAVPSAIAPPATLQDPVRYSEHVSRLLSSMRPVCIVTEPELIQRFRTLALNAAVPMLNTPADLLGRGGGGMMMEHNPSDIAILQFTSGSTGSCRAIRVPFGALETNVTAIRQWLQWTETVPGASWLPLHHDMGLIGCLLTPIVSQCNQHLMDPEQFLRHPIEYIRCFGEYGAELTAIPNFGLDHIVRRVHADALAGMGFSRWRGIIVGGERLREQSFSSFHRLLSPFGFKKTSLLPAYGLAEATLAVTGVPLDQEWTEVSLNPVSIDTGARIVAGRDPLSSTILIGCGRPLAGVSIEITDGANRLLPEDHIGEIVVSGDSVAAGYAGGIAAPNFMDGVLRTGDAGFLHQGQLFVLGRLGDSLKVHGRSVYAEDVESALVRLGIPVHRMAALLGWHKAEPVAAVVLEHPAADWLLEAHSILRAQAAGAAIRVLEVPRGTIPRTSSGKIRRKELWHAFTAGDLELKAVTPWRSRARATPAAAGEIKESIC